MKYGILKLNENVTINHLNKTVCVKSGYCLTVQDYNSYEDEFILNSVIYGNYPFALSVENYKDSHKIKLINNYVLIIEMKTLARIIDDLTDLEGCVTDTTALFDELSAWEESRFPTFKPSPVYKKLTKEDEWWMKDNLDKIEFRGLHSSKPSYLKILDSDYVINFERFNYRCLDSIFIPPKSLPVALRINSLTREEWQRVMDEGYDVKSKYSSAWSKLTINPFDQVESLRVSITIRREVGHIQPNFGYKPNLDDNAYIIRVYEDGSCHGSLHKDVNYSLKASLPFKSFIVLAEGQDGKL